MGATLSSHAAPTLGAPVGIRLGPLNLFGGQVAGSTVRSRTRRTPRSFVALGAASAGASPTRGQTRSTTAVVAVVWTRPRRARLVAASTRSVTRGGAVAALSWAFGEFLGPRWGSATSARSPRSGLSSSTTWSWSSLTALVGARTSFVAVTSHRSLIAGSGRGAARPCVATTPLETSLGAVAWRTCSPGGAGAVARSACGRGAPRGQFSRTGRGFSILARSRTLHGRGAPGGATRGGFRCGHRAMLLGANFLWNLLERAQVALFTPTPWHSLKRVHLELGGNSAMIIMDNADVEKAATVGLSGPSCTKGRSA